MMKKLVAYVHGRELDGDMRSFVLGPDDDMSAPENSWAVKWITNKNAWEGGELPAEAKGNDTKLVAKPDPSISKPSIVK
jgi:hypothetical protein